jgi:hypothetical protein
MCGAAGGLNGVNAAGGVAPIDERLPVSRAGCIADLLDGGLYGASPAPR